MKKLATTILLSTGILCLSAPAFGIDVYVNNDKMNFEVQPTVENGSTLVPMRAIFEKLGATVDYDGKTQVITSKKDDTTIILNPHSAIAQKNDLMIFLEPSAKVVNGNTLVPLRFISESLDYKVDYDAMLEDVFIYNTDEGNTIHKKLHKEYYIVGNILDEMAVALRGGDSLTDKEYYQNFINNISGSKTIGNIKAAVIKDYQKYVNNENSELSYMWEIGDTLYKAIYEEGKLSDSQIKESEQKLKEFYKKVEQNKDKTTFPK